MWETVFEESMLNDHKNLIIHCPREDLVEDLMKILERNGVMWGVEQAPTATDNKWNVKGVDTCYWVESKELFYDEKQYADEDYGAMFDGHIRCTFYGISQDFDVASENEILSLFDLIGSE